MSITPEELELKSLRLVLVDLVAEHFIGQNVRFCPTLCIFDEELEDLLGMQADRQRHALAEMAGRAVAMLKK